MPLIGARAGGKETVCLSINTDNSNPSAICPSSGFIVIANELTVRRRMALKISSLQLRYTSWPKNEQHFILKHSNWGQANKQTQHLLFFTSEKLSEIFGVSNHITDLWSDHILKFQALKQLKRTNIYYSFSPSKSQTLNSELSLKFKVWNYMYSWKPKRQDCTRTSLSWSYRATEHRGHCRLPARRVSPGSSSTPLSRAREAATQFAAVFQGSTKPAESLGFSGRNTVDFSMACASNQLIS